jgi:hypothetical protein
MAHNDTVVLAAEARRSVAQIPVSMKNVELPSICSSVPTVVDAVALDRFL